MAGGEEQGTGLIRAFFIAVSNKTILMYTLDIKSTKTCTQSVTIE